LANKESARQSGANGFQLYKNVRCALCRELSRPENVHFVATNRAAQDTEQSENRSKAEAAQALDGEQDVNGRENFQIRVRFYFPCSILTFNDLTSLTIKGKQ
jgi:hypothetical protein